MNNLDYSSENIVEYDAEMHPTIANSAFSSSIRALYVDYLKTLGHDIKTRDEPTLNCLNLHPNNLDKRMTMTISKRRAQIFEICANASKEPLYHLSPDSFMKMYHRELEYLCTQHDDEIWDKVDTSILHEADQRLIPYDPSNVDFAVLEDLISEYDHYLKELDWKFEPWKREVDELRYMCELMQEDREWNSGRSTVVIDRTRL